MTHPDQRPRLANRDADFFAQLARQPLARRLARLEFAAWEFPRAGQMFSGRPLRDQHAP